jgi:hypothetical protein
LLGLFSLLLILSACIQLQKVVLLLFYNGDLLLLRLLFFLLLFPWHLFLLNRLNWLLQRGRLGSAKVAQQRLDLVLI